MNTLSALFDLPLKNGHFLDRERKKGLWIFLFLFLHILYLWGSDEFDRHNFPRDLNTYSFGGTAAGKAILYTTAVNIFDTRCVSSEMRKQTGLWSTCYFRVKWRSIYLSIDHDNNRF